MNMNQSHPEQWCAGLIDTHILNKGGLRSVCNLVDRVYTDWNGLGGDLQRDR